MKQSKAMDRLWASWVIEAEGKRIFFAGDTGYAKHFKEIGNKYGHFDLALLPIGAYEPRWFMKPYHINPDEAVQIHLLLVYMNKSYVILSFLGN